MKKLWLTIQGTIMGDSFDEISIKEFIETIDKDWGCGYSIIYDEESNIFKVMFQDDFYELVLDEIIMDNYKLGHYNEFTYKIKELIDIKENVRTKKYELIGYLIEDKKTLEIVKNARKGIFSSIEDKEVFLNYLETLKRETKEMKYLFLNLNKYKSLSETYKIATSIVVDFIKECYDLITVYLLFSIFFKILIYFILVVASIIAVFPPLISLTITLIAKFNFERSINNSIKNVKADINRVNLLHESKQRQLEEGKEELVDKNVKTGDTILDELLGLSKRIAGIKENANIDISEISKLETEIINISKEYIEGKIEIEMQSLDDETQLGGENEFSLQSDIIKKIASIEFRLRKLEEISGNIDKFDEKRQVFEGAMADILKDDSEDRVIGGNRSPRAKKL